MDEQKHGDGEKQAFTGSGKTFEEAVHAAFTRAVEAGEAEPGSWFDLLATSLRVENPIREYRVVIRPGG